MQNSQILRGQYPGTRFRGEESLFSFSENIPKLFYSNAEFENFPGDNTRTIVLGAGKFVFVLGKITKTLSYSNAEFTNSPGTIPRTPVLGEREVCFRSPKMYKTLLQQCRISKQIRGRTGPWTPVLGNGRGKLPPLEIVSGYATGYARTRFSSVTEFVASNDAMCR